MKMFLNVSRENPVCRYLTAPSTVSGSVPIRVMAESLRPMSLITLSTPLNHTQTFNSNYREKLDS